MGIALWWGLAAVLAVAEGDVQPPPTRDGLERDHPELPWIDETRSIASDDDLPFAAAPSPRAAQRATLYVNFDGAHLLPGNEDARANETAIPEYVGNFPPYGGTSQRAAVLQAVQLDFDAYDIVVVDSRPAAGEYTMAMVGPLDEGSTLGIALLDCDDRYANNIVYAFHGDGDGYSPASQANTISQEVAHSYGLEHVNHQGDLMYPMSTGGDPAFLDLCVPIVPSPDIGCPGQHAQYCPEAQQNSHRELLGRFGARTPDDVDPAVAIVEPHHEDELDVGADFDIVADAIDERALANVVLFVNESNIGGRTQAPYTWHVDDMPMGVFDMYVIAVDAAGNMSRSETVTIYVGVDSPRKEEEHGCRIGGDAPGVAWLAIALFGLRRRRR
jgi:MYXO-CTERM domain-containing protein